MDMRIARAIGFGLYAFTVATTAGATPPPEENGEAGPANDRDAVTHAIESYVVERGLRPRVEAARLARQQLAERIPGGPQLVDPIVGPVVEGTVEIPVIATLFSDTASEPYPVADLQQQLFDGPWPTGTMAEHYLEMSRDNLRVQGEVFDWIRLPQNEAFYAGPAGCNATCSSARLGELLVAALQGVDGDVEFTRFDNDGPDGTPNSGDDDGFVDFVAFLHPSFGGECSNIANNASIWSHRWQLSRWTGQTFQTNDASALGPNIRVDDYVIMPALSCDATTMIPIGVFSHEFGHAFGLPDLYDSNASDGGDPSSGMGTWDLMASGSWGGDDAHPETPSHMSAWSKEFLGWVAPTVIEADTQGVELRPVVSSGDVVRIDYTIASDPEDTRYLLLEYRRQEGFDKELWGSGLLVTEVNNARVQSGLVNNSVNGLPFDMGVNVVEADGDRALDNGTDRGDAGDPFPGRSGALHLDAGHAEAVRAALCNIDVTDQRIRLDVFVSRSTCPDTDLDPLAVTPETAVATGVVGGEELVVKGIIENAGTNYFTDQRLVMRGEDGSEIAVTAPFALETAEPIGTAGTEAGGVDPSAGPGRLSEVLGQEVVVRGHLTRDVQQGVGLTDVLVIEELQLAD